MKDRLDRGSKIFCVVFSENHLLFDEVGQASCFLSKEQADAFIEQHRELGLEAQIHEVSVNS